MKQFTFSAQVANNLLTLLQGYSKTIRLLLVMFLTLTVTTNAWAADVTCDFTTQSAGSSQYTASWNYGDFTVFGGANNNKGWAYVKMGGKNTNLATANPVYISSPKMTSAISKVQVSIIAGSLAQTDMSVNSWGVYVYSDANMTNQVDYVAGGTITKNAAVFEFTPTSGTTWSANNYYKVSFNLRNTSTTNGIIWLDKITFVESTGGGGGSTPTQLAAPTGLTVDAITSSGATLSWDAVANASSYIVTMVDGASLEQDYPVTETTKTFDNLNPSTDYLWTVTAVGDGINYTNSEESKTSEFTTSAPAGGDGDEGSSTGTINFNSNAVVINDASVNGNDNLGNSWTITTAGTTSFTSNAAYYQVGSSQNPATSITFTTTLPQQVTITDFSAKFGGFSGTAGTVTLEVDDTSVGTGSLNASNDVTVSNSSQATGKKLTVTVTDIAKGVKVYYISYTYTTSSGGGEPETPATELTDAQFAWSAATAEATMGATNTFPTLTNTVPVSVTYESSNTSTATIAADGTITLVAPGTTTISAKFAGGEVSGTTYAAKTVSYTLTVKKAPLDPIAGGVIDILNQEWTGVSGTNYTDVAEKTAENTGHSNAKYVAQCAGDKSSIQLRSNNSNSGVVSTVSGGVVKRIEVEWHADTDAARTLQIYGSNTAYTAATDLYGDAKGELLGELNKGEGETTLDFSEWTGDYKYIGFRSKSGAMYLTTVTITWLPTISKVTIDDQIENGSISVSGAADLNSVAAGTVLTLSNTPATNYKLAAYDVYKTGDATTKVTVTDGKFIMPEFDVTISATFVPVKTLTSIEITTAATQTTFWQGETFNYTGLVVTARFSGAADEVVTPTVTGSTATAGTQTVTVSYTEGTVTKTATYTIEVKAIPNTKETAYSVADAYDIIDKLTTATDVFITGTISQVDSYNSTYKSITYWISADGTTTNQLQVYSGKGLESADFAAVTDLTVGDKVIVCGNLKMHNSTYEFDYNNYLAAYTPTTKAPAGLEYETTEYTVNLGEEFATPVLTNPNGLTVTYSTSDASKATVDANTGAVTVVAAGTVTITASTIGDATHDAGTASYTITIIDPYENIARLPFNYNSGKADIETTAGITYSGLGSDYADAPYLKFDGTGDYVIIHFDVEPGILSYDIKGNSFSGGTFTVQESENGETYTDIVAYTELAAKETKTHNLASSSRYVKFIYTEKSGGNVALGNISIQKPDLRADAGLVWNPTSVTLTQGDAFTAPTLQNPKSVSGITYKSSNDEVATVTAEGVIALASAIGTATITATFDGDATYKPATATCTIIVNAIPALSAPTGLTVTDLTCSSVTLSWNAVTNATGYEVVRTLNAHNTTYTTDEPSITIKDLTGGLENAWKVRAMGDGVNHGNSDYTTGDNFTTLFSVKYYVDEVLWHGCDNDCAANDGSFEICETTPTKANYDFAGWATSVGGEVAYQAGETINNIAANVTLHAVWTLKKYTVTYHGFGGYSTICGDNPAEKVVEVGSTFTVATCTPEDPKGLGRIFAGEWYTNPNGRGDTYKPGDSFVVEEDVVLYAKWTLNTNTAPLPVDDENKDLATTDIVVTGGNTLTLQAGTTTINSLTLKGGLQENGTYAMPVVNIPTGATLVRNNNKINLDLVVNNDSWYPFAVPFEVENTAANVNYINTTLKEYANGHNGYGKYYRILEYNGALRAEKGLNNDSNWVHVGRTDVKLMPGKGYAISAVPASGQDTVTIRITMTVDNAWLANGEQESITVKEQTTTRNQVTVTAYTGKATDINNGGHQRHAGWNFVANPYLSMFAGGNVANDVTYIKGSINIQENYTYENTDVTYVTIPAYDFSYYEQVKLSGATLSPAYSFFVQVGTEGTMTFETAGRKQVPAGIAARSAEEQAVKMDVDITLSDNHSSDQTGIIISDRYSDAYEIGRDLEKLFGSAYNLSVYTLMADNTPLAFQALAIRSNMQVIPIGYRAPEQGEYTFRLNEATSSIDLLNEQYEQLVLVDYQTGELTNLLIADYTFYSERTQSDNRFALYAVPRQNAPTDLPNAIGQDKEAQKIIHNGHLYILRDGNVYNGNGQIVK